MLDTGIKVSSLKTICTIIHFCQQRKKRLFYPSQSLNVHFKVTKKHYFNMTLNTTECTNIRGGGYREMMVHRAVKNH